MSEKQEESKTSFRAERIPMKEFDKKLSRRDFLKLAAGLGLAGGGTALAYHFGKKSLEEFGYQSGGPGESSGNFFNKESQILSRATEVAKTEEPESTLEAQGTPEPTKEPTPESELITEWRFGNIDFGNKDKQIGIAYFLGENQILVPNFTPITWFEGLYETGAFEPKENTGLIYLDSSNRKILNVHSGRQGPLHQEGYSAYKLQIYLEEHPENGVRRLPIEINKVVANIIGSDVVFKQEDKFAYSKIVAAVRVPPLKVIESQQHVFDIVSWLSQNYPDSGFRNVQGGDRNIVVTKFCGRLLGGEQNLINDLENKDLKKAINDLPESQKSRFFIAEKLT